MMTDNNNDIDLVVTWVDGSDPEWEKNYSRFSGHAPAPEYLFRDWGWMRFWFRGVERNIPWVRKIHFIASGDAPEWLDKNHPRLNIVRHRDFIPEKYLPTFSANAIELNIHRITELSEKFVFCNDDFFFVGAMEPEDYFHDDLPCDCLHVRPVTESNSKQFIHLLLNNMVCLNRNFDMHQCMENNREKWFSDRYTEDILNDNSSALRWNKFMGLWYDHMPLPLTKSSLQELWQAEPALMDEVSARKFRDFDRDVNIFLCRFWNLASGKFVPYMRPKGAYCLVSDDCEKLLCSIRAENSVICLNDTDNEFNFEERREYILSLLSGLFPDKSSFELF